MAIVILVLGILAFLAFIAWVSVIVMLWILGIAVFLIAAIAYAVGQHFGYLAGWSVAAVLTFAPLAALGSWSSANDQTR